MQDTLGMMMLICASLAALAFGVLGAHVICKLAFAGLRMHARSVAADQSELKAKVAAA